MKCFGRKKEKNSTINHSSINHSTNNSTDKSPSQDVWFQFGIYVSENNQLVGDCGVYLKKDNQAEIGYTISPNFQKQGYGVEAVQGLINFLCDQFDVLKVVASCDPRNTASINLLKKLGFEQDGFYPKSVEIRGEWMDDVVYVKSNIP